MRIGNRFLTKVGMLNAEGEERKAGMNTETKLLRTSEPEGL